MDPKRLIIKVVAQKGCSDKPNRSCLTSFGITLILGAIKLTILCAFICIVRYFDAKIRETLLYKLGI